MRAELSGSAGVHSTEQRLDEAVEHLRTKPRDDQVGNRRVAGGWTATRQHQIERRTRQACRGHESRLEQRQQTVGHSEKGAGREPSQLAARPHMRPQRGRGHDLVAQAEVFKEGSHRRHAHQQGVGPGVDYVTAEPLGGDLATQLGAALDESEPHR